MSNTIILKTELSGLQLANRGKVRDVYDLGDALLIVSTDRISAFDVVLPNGIPDKGKVLTALSVFWFEHMNDIVPHHIITTDVSAYPPSCRPYADVLQGRSMLVKKARPLPVECIVRGYISGSGWKDYQKTGAICGIPLPPGLRESEELPEPIFTPSTKADIGMHDENISFEQAQDLVGKEIAETVRSLSIAIYKKAKSIAEQKGIIIADTKMEFGIVDGSLILIDELLTPDSSRFWPKDSYVPGRPQPSYDKQFVRDYLLSLNWDQKPPAPVLPEDIVQKTAEKYREACRRLTGRNIGA
ncbi:MAG: phosphoribosylaminoimidazolesuccinocarboxamide synthase [Desulfobacterota bacterium]|nr:phosphoribosylaminoimidazolesuccinocarboxamide synthase [Thermodesulfobacteriota bacterium]